MQPAQLELQENTFNMDPKIFNIIKENKDRPNRDLETAMNYLNEEFEKTKDLIVKLSKHLDNVEFNYNKVLKEYESRKKS
jgi:hypothetical protein